MNLNQEAVMYRGAAGSTASTEVGIIETNAFSSKRNEVDGNFRKSRITNTRVGQMKRTGTVAMERKSDDASYVAFKNAHNAGTAIAIKLVPLSSDTNEVIDIDVVIPTWDFDEGMDGVQKGSFTYAQNTDIRQGTVT